MRAESGTCNMCSAPCSSCLHANRALMGSKADEFSDESSEGNAGSQYSVNEVVPVKRAAYRSGQNSASETSNLFSVNSNQDSLSENAESKACLRTGDVEMHKNLLSGVTGGDKQLLLKPQYNAGNRTLTKKFGDQEVLESHGECISCVSSVNEPKVLASHDNRTVIGESHSFKNMTDLEAETDKVSGGLPTDAVSSPEHIEEIEVVKESHGLPGLKENSQPVDDSDESDIEEQDVSMTLYLLYQPSTPWGYFPAVPFICQAACRRLVSAVIGLGCIPLFYFYFFYNVETGESLRYLWRCRSRGFTCHMYKVQ